ncbi:EAL domain-containing protein [Paraburkholderia lycopersici]|uniref:PAS domain S-box-containing protein/diguanylate cyclase (GGDEF) domain-containing protein n=1 Tax=Paraburkholderia lycopersici TaxID=416944 RepID=A0A1G6NS84_9BURK|nr:EAL domain-containing protein [Paraburkholderia lycopersici]SDC70830.1 PAS domain S-box-containing protein/diguanylate cyclase (GGDEF) domain-containing protein [Paraburkholderia lycopersici]
MMRSTRRETGALTRAGETSRQAPGRRGLRRTTAVLLPLWLLAAAMTLIASISVAIMAILLAYVAGESSWSKGQKDAVHALERYARTGDEADYGAFLAGIAVPLGDRAARLEMNRAQPDPAAIRRGFERGRIAHADMDGMVWGYRTLKNTPWLRPAVAFWDTGDRYIVRLADTGERLHALGRAGKLHAPESASLVHELQDIDSELAPVESGFSRSLDDAARTTRSLLMLVLAAAAIVLLGVFSQFIRRALARSERLEAEVRKNEERLTLGFEGINAGLWDWEIGSRQCYFSNWLYEQLGYDVGTRFDSEAGLAQLVHADDLSLVRHALREHLARATTFDVAFRLRTLAGGYCWCRARGQAVRDAHGRAVRMVGCLFDISELRNAEAKAYTERELAEVTLASIGDAVIRTDEDARVTYCNAVAERMLGRAAADIVAQPFDAVCKLRNDADGARRFDILSVAHAKSGSASLYLSRPDGSRLAVDYSVSKLRDAQGRAIGTVIVLYDVSALREHAARLAYQATHDELTDLYNRREFERRLTALLENDERAQPAHPGHAVMFLDLDQFKVVNDTCGHSTGDELLRQVCRALKSELRDEDIIARLGGDEFGVVMPHCTAAHASLLAENLRAAIAAIRFTGAGRVVQTSVSIGLVGDAEGLVSVKEVMKAADVACYMAKKKGRNRVHRFRYDDEELSQTHAQMAWVSDIKAALENGQFCLYGQPMLALAQASAPAAPEDTHVELLLRMRSHSGTLVEPAAFIGAAERFDLMPAIDRWVIARAFAMIAANTHRYGTWAINLSGASLGDGQLADYIEAQQRIWSVPFARVCFEITETAAITNLHEAITLIERLRAQGCRFALDDFGAGMSSFNYLKHLNVDYLKIDASFIRGIVGSPLDQAIVRAINEVAHAAGKLTIAEGVEDAAIMDLMIAMGLDYAQGYRVGRPVQLDVLREPELRDMAEPG